MIHYLYDGRYTATDTVDGTRVVWHQIPLHNKKVEQKATIQHDITQLIKLNHPNVLKVHDSWITLNGKYIVYITDLMNNTLKQYVVVSDM
jgi:hypothetical protein